jgi:hypothetical protein
LVQELQALQPPEREDPPVPRHPNAGKEKAIKARGDQTGRLAPVAVFRSRSDPHRRHQRGYRADRGDRDRSRRRVVAVRGSLRFPASAVSADADLGRQAPEEATQRSRRQPHLRSTSHGRHLASAQQTALGAALASDSPSSRSRSHRGKFQVSYSTRRAIT